MNERRLVRISIWSSEERNEYILLWGMREGQFQARDDDECFRERDKDVCWCLDPYVYALRG